VLAWLWLEGPTPRSRLAGLLWPDVPEDRARGNLRQRLLKLRQDAGDIVVDAAGLLSLGPGVVVAPPDPPGAPLLQNLDFDDCEAFARWLDGRREAERERRKREWLAEVREAVSPAQGQRLDDALYAADQLLQTDRESEEAYRVLMEVYYLRGDHAAALSAWDRCRDMLRQLYGVLPSAATRQLGDTILSAAQAAEASRAAQAAWAPTPPGSRQIPATVLRPPRLVGRDAAMQALREGWFAGNVLCVAGPAGVGKSRLLADWAAALGPVTLATARPGDAVLPYASLSRLLLAALDRFQPPLDSAHAAQAARVLPRLASLAGLAVEPVRTDHERTQALLALARLLADCVQRGAQAFVLDDLQFAAAPAWRRCGCWPNIPSIQPPATACALLSACARKKPAPTSRR
jgi:DNA-binding SARP family transcriptional activator